MDFESASGNEQGRMSAHTRIKTVLVEPETLLRTMLARFIILSQPFTLAADYDQISLAREGCLSFNPNLLVIDVDFDIPGSLALIREVISGMRTRILAISTAKNPHLMHELYRLAIHGFVTRDEPIEILEEAMLEVATGGEYLPAFFLRNEKEFRTKSEKISNLLTEKETEILRKVAAGGTSKVIAAEIGLSPRSVETYRCRMMRKLAVPNSAGLIEFAFKTGLSNGSVNGHSRSSKAENPALMPLS